MRVDELSTARGAGGDAVKALEEAEGSLPLAFASGGDGLLLFVALEDLPPEYWSVHTKTAKARENARCPMCGRQPPVVHPLSEGWTWDTLEPENDYCWCPEYDDWLQGRSEKSCEELYPRLPWKGNAGEGAHAPAESQPTSTADHALASAATRGGAA